MVISTTRGAGKVTMRYLPFVTGGGVLSFSAIFGDPSTMSNFKLRGHTGDSTGIDLKYLKLLSAILSYDYLISRSRHVFSLNDKNLI